MAPRKRRRKRKKARNLHVGDSVIVKPGVMDVDLDVEIGGWQGRTTEIAPQGNQEMVVGAWDSVTLRDMPDAMIEQSEEQGLNWAAYGIEVSNIELTTPRDTEADVIQTVQALSREFAWTWLGEEGKRINRILKGINPKDEMALFRAWETYLSEHLDFPFEAEISEYQRRGPLQMEDRVNVLEISLVANLYGVIVAVRHGRRKYDLPLCDLEVMDEDSPNRQPVSDYSLWFANR